MCALPIYRQLERGDHAFIGGAIDLHMVGLRDTRSGVHQIFGPARVVRQKKQTLAHLIEPPDWRDKRQILRQTIIDRFTLLWIAARGQIGRASCRERGWQYV